MSNLNVGIDVSAFQATVPAGEWLFKVHKATEGTTFVDPRFSERFPTLGGVRGAYHYARPGYADGITQANHFADTVLAAGFRPGIDMWQLDCEATGNNGIGQGQWQPFILNFMAQAERRLGKRGFLYGGFYFLFAAGSPVNAPANWLNAFNWWDADYGHNDGTVYPLQCPEPYASACVVHQFSSAGGLDQNVVNNDERWNALFPPAPVIPVGVLKLARFVASAAVKPLVYGEKGWRVNILQSLLRQKHYALHLTDVYDEPTQAAVYRFKVRNNLPNRDGKKFGGRVVALLAKGTK